MRKNWNFVSVQESLKKFNRFKNKKLTHFVNFTLKNWINEISKSSLDNAIKQLIKTK